MSVARSILGAAGHATRLVRHAGAQLGLRGAAALRVLIYHDVPARYLPQYEAQLRALAREWQFISPHEFETLMSGEMPIVGRKLLVTFDDGFASNRTVAEQVLRPLGIRALFFVVPGFVDCGDRDSSRRYIAERIQPGRRIEDLDVGLGNMTWDDLGALLEQGHVIGAHTETHVRLDALLLDGEREREVVGSGDRIARRLGCTVAHFAFPFGGVEHLNARVVSTAAKRYRFVHSGLRGNNRSVSPLAIRRDALAPGESIGVAHAILEGLADARYSRSRAFLDDLADREL